MWSHRTKYCPDSYDQHLHRQPLVLLERPPTMAAPGFTLTHLEAQQISDTHSCVGCSVTRQHPLSLSNSTSIKAPPLPSIPSPGRFTDNHVCFYANQLASRPYRRPHQGTQPRPGESESRGSILFEFLFLLHSFGRLLGPGRPWTLAEPYSFPHPLPTTCAPNRCGESHLPQSGSRRKPRPQDHCLLPGLRLQLLPRPVWLSGWSVSQQMEGCQV